MACNAPCTFKYEANQLRKKLESLDPVRVAGKIERAQKSAVRAINERDCARRRAEEWKGANRKLQDQMEALKDRLVWAEEDLQNRKASDKAERKAWKKRIQELEKELSTAQWRLEKQQRDSEKAQKRLLEKQEEAFRKKLAEVEEQYKKELSEKNAIIEVLTEHLQKGTAYINGGSGDGEPAICSTKTDSTNSSVSPGQDPNHKTIPNNREPSGRKPGGQKGHKAQPRKKLKPTTTVELPPPQVVVDHPGDYYEIGEVRKQVLGVRLVVEVTEYVGKKYRNHKTREMVHSDFPECVGHLEVNYDESVEALATYLHSVCNVPYNKIQELFREAMEGGPLPVSTGKLANLEKKFSKLSEKERLEIAENLFRGKTMNIDGVCVRVNGKQRQVLVMRNGKQILYKMTGCKGDKAVIGTPAENYQGTVISDGESTFTKLGKRRQGCLVHEGRYVRHAQDVTPGLTWHREMRELLGNLQHRRKEDMGRGTGRMPEKERKEAEKKYEEILKKGVREYEGLCRVLLYQQLLTNERKLSEDAEKYSLDFGKMRDAQAEKVTEYMVPEVRKALQKDINTMIRLMSEKEHYLLFLTDYTIPPHNNDAEKAARVVKIHAKPNGGMRSEGYVGYYADTASVMETESLQGRSRFGKLKEVFQRGTKEITKKFHKGKYEKER